MKYQQFIKTNLINIRLCFKIMLIIYTEFKKPVISNSLVSSS